MKPYLKIHNIIRKQSIYKQFLYTSTFTNLVVMCQEEFLIKSQYIFLDDGGETSAFVVSSAHFAVFFSRSHSFFISCK